MIAGFNLNRIFSFEDLPENAKHDFLLQFENDFEFNKNDYFFKLKLVSYDELTAELDEILGPNLLDEIAKDYVIALAKDIRKNGLQNPPIGSEGVHRTLAHYYLKKDMLRFEIIYSPPIDE